MKFHQGQFIPKNPKKYVGDVTNIIFRSGWERKAMIFFDENPSILKWGSEEVVVPYVSPVDGRPHRYYPDFIIKIKTRDGLEQNIMVEIKPASQCEPPKQKKQTKRMITETQTYMVNQAKWQAAESFCNRNGLKFQVITEYDLGLAKRK